MELEALRMADASGLDQAASKREEIAEGFERLFARHLVEQITKDSFGSADNSMGTGGSGRMVRSRIVDTLADALASERALGMADMVDHFWGQRVPSTLNESEEVHDG